MGQEQYRGGGGHVTSGSYPSLPLCFLFLVSSSRAAAGRASLNVARQYIHSHLEIDQPKESCDEEPSSLAVQCIVVKRKKKKSPIRETSNLSTDADRSIDTN